MQDPIVSSSESEVVYTSDTEEDIYITASEDEDNSSDPRLELINNLT